MQYKWSALSVTSVGALMAAVDSTVVLLALYPIATDLHSSLVTMIWIIIGYLLVNTALVLSLGRLADMYGRKKMYNIGFVIFTIGSALSGLAFSGFSLVGFRVIQGVGAALLTANSFAILSEAFPRNETGRAFGINAIVWGIGSVLGIVLGGLIITFSTWRLIFLINVPIGVFATIWAYITLRESKSQKPKESFDIPAAISFTAGLLAILFGVTWGLIQSWTDPITIVSFAVSPFLLAFFFVWEAKYSKDPIVDLGFFRNRVFSFAIMAALLQSLALFSVNFLLIFYLEGIAGLSILNASYLLIPLAVTISVVGPFGGMLSDRFGARIVSSVGLAVQFIVLLLLSLLTTSTPLPQIALIETLYGLGGGLFWPANTSAIMGASPPAKYGVASGIMNTFRSTGMIMSFAVSLTAATAVIPAYIVDALFVGDLNLISGLVNGKLSIAYQNSYLGGQSFAFEISTVLLIFATVFSLVNSKKVKRMIPPQAEPEKAETSAIPA
jgi:EmrB/QacA subfamily drug resistance transporter